MAESGRLQDRIVIVTGATSGIGHAVAERCIVEGAVVVATGRRAGALQELQAAHGDRLIPVTADLSADGECDRLVAAAAERGPLQGVVHAADTVWRGEDTTQTTTAAILAFMTANLAPAFALTSAAAEAMAGGGGGGGSIVLVG